MNRFQSYKQSWGKEKPTIFTTTPDVLPTFNPKASNVMPVQTVPESNIEKNEINISPYQKEGDRTSRMFVIICILSFLVFIFAILFFSALVYANRVSKLHSSLIQLLVNNLIKV